MNIIIWIVLGVIAGLLAKTVEPEARGVRMFFTILLGILGAFGGGSLGVFLETGGLMAASSLSACGIVVAFLGATIAVFIWDWFTSKTVL